MSRRDIPYASGFIEEMENYQADGHLRQDRFHPRRWSESDDEYSARMHSGHSQPTEPRHDSVHRAMNYFPGYSTSVDGESPPPYYERDDHLGGGEVLPDYYPFNMYPNGGRPDYVTDSSGRRDRFVRDERGERVAWPLPDHVDTSDDDSGSDMVHLESGRVLPRSEWEADHSWEPSSEEPSDEEFSQRRRSPMPQTRTSAYSTPERERHDREVARIRGGHGAGAGRGRRESHQGYGAHSRHNFQERHRRWYGRLGRSSGHH